MKRRRFSKKIKKKSQKRRLILFLLILAENFEQKFMITPSNKKRLVVSFNNLPAELQEEVKQFYPAGYFDAMIRIDKPNGDFFYAVPFETEEISYLVKIDVKIDDLSDEDDDKEYYDEEIKGADEIQDDGSDDESLDDAVADYDGAI